MAGLKLVDWGHRIKAYIVRATTPAHITADDGLRYWQERIVLSFTLVCTFLGLFVLIPSVLLSIKESLWLVAAVDILMYGWILLLFLRPSISFEVRAFTLVGITYMLGLVLLLTIGPYGGGPVWLFSFPVFVALLLGFRHALTALGLNALTLAVIGYFINHGGDRWGAFVVNTEERWLVIGLNFLLLNSLVTLSVALIARGLSEALIRQKAMLAAKEESEERFRILFESAPDGFFLYDLTGTLRDGNRTVESMLGYERRELIGRRVLDPDLSEADQRPRAEAVLRKNQQLQGTGPDEFTLIRKGGERIVVEIMTVPATIRGETLILGIIRDITERRQLQANLVHAQKMESIGTLAGGVAHDFNNLLQSIGGYTDLLAMNKPEGHPDLPNLMVVRRSVDRAAQLVKQLLLFSRKAHAQPRPLDLNRIVSQTLTILERTIPKMIRIEHRSREGLWTVAADPVQMEQLILNLGSNSADAMPQGGSFTVETDNVWLGQGFPDTNPGISPGRFVLIKVSDTGCGMEPEMVQHIFEPFFTSKDVGKGTGLGLASVYGIVKGHSGTISCQSEPGRGTTFHIHLPAFAAEEGKQGLP
jgi:PAS domain S-box-containing protein